MRVPEYRVIGIPGLPEIRPGSGLGELVCRAVRAASLEVVDRDILVVTQKVVSKDEGRTVRLESVKPSRLARTWASELGKDPALVEIILSQSRRIVRMDRGRLIVETHHGFVLRQRRSGPVQLRGRRGHPLAGGSRRLGSPPPQLPGAELPDPPGRDRFGHLRPALA